MSLLSFKMQVNSLLVSLLLCLFPLLLPFLFRFQSCTNVSTKNLQRQLDILEGESVIWQAQAEEYGRTLAGSLQYCATRDEISEVGGRGQIDTLPKASLSQHLSQCLCLHVYTHTESGEFLFTLEI